MSEKKLEIALNARLLPGLGDSDRPKEKLLVRDSGLGPDDSRLRNPNSPAALSNPLVSNRLSEKLFVREGRLSTEFSRLLIPNKHVPLSIPLDSLDILPRLIWLGLVIEPSSISPLGFDSVEFSPPPNRATLWKNDGTGIFISTRCWRGLTAVSGSILIL